MPRVLRSLALVTLLVAGCAAPAKKQRGAQCELNSECDTPLVCRIGACRKECTTTRDCAAGTQCVLDAAGLGACQLETELHCARASDCPSPLVCASTRCVDACHDDRDCPPGAACVAGTDGVLGCIDPSVTACVRDSECTGVTVEGHRTVCAVDGRCRLQCMSDRECRYRTVCDPVDDTCKPASMLLDGGPDLGAVDGGAPGDGGVDMMVAPPCSFTTSQVRSVAVSAVGACAVVGAAGDVWCWGASVRDALGMPGLADGTVVAMPTMTPITNAARVVGNNATFCAILGTGELVCWGDNTYGQLARGSAITTSATPVMPFAAGGTVVDDVSLGVYAAYAVSGGQVYGWGDRTWSALGDATTTGIATFPTTNPSMAGATDVEGMEWGACAMRGGQVYCWGFNGGGVLGNGSPWPTVHNASFPTNVSGIMDAMQITTSVSPVCALHADGSVSCWGDDTNGACGDGMSGTSAAPLYRTTPVAVVGLPSPARQVAAGNDFACARLGSGEVRCWGSNRGGSLGDGTVVDRSSASLPVILPRPATSIVAGEGYGACAILDDQSLWCWGRGFPGDGTAGPITATPVRACLP